MKIQSQLRNHWIDLTTESIHSKNRRKYLNLVIERYKEDRGGKN